MVAICITWWRRVNPAIERPLLRASPRSVKDQCLRRDRGDTVLAAGSVWTYVPPSRCADRYDGGGAEAERVSPWLRPKEGMWFGRVHRVLC